MRHFDRRPKTTKNMDTFKRFLFHSQDRERSKKEDQAIQVPEAAFAESLVGG